MRVLPWVVVALLAYLVVAAAASAGSCVVRRRRARTVDTPSGAHGWERGRTRSTATPGGGGPAHDAMLAFIESHDGVEAHVEPRTVVSPMTVVLVDADGEWHRFEIGEDRVLRPLVWSHGLSVFDASRVGYPPRMRRSGDPAEG